MRVELVFLPSPFLGPAVWGPMVTLLRDAGWAASVCPTPADLCTAERAADGFLQMLSDRRPLVLIPHSNAGLFVPHLSRHRDVVASVFVDAALPPLDGSYAIAPESLIDLVGKRAEADGRLPPWTDWWEETDVEPLFPSVAVREGVEALQPRVPLTYLRSRLEAWPGWNESPSAYLAFGDTYAAEVDQARQWNWPVEVMPGGHLHMLVRPEDVVRRVSSLLRAVGVQDPGP